MQLFNAAWAWIFQYIWLLFKYHTPYFWGYYSPRLHSVGHHALIPILSASMAPFFQSLLKDISPCFQYFVRSVKSELVRLDNWYGKTVVSCWSSARDIIQNRALPQHKPFVIWSITRWCIKINLVVAVYRCDFYILSCMSDFVPGSNFLGKCRYFSGIVA